MDIQNLLYNNFDHNTDEKFAEIAAILLNQSLLVINHAYRITDIEFYWVGEKHKDGSTYDRRHTDKLPTGSLFIHYSGVDIALDNDYGYGGILIRGIIDIATHKMYTGPLVCCMRLMSGQLILNGDAISVQLKTYKHEVLEIHKGPKKGIGKNGQEGGFDKRLYRFYLKPNQIKKVYTIK